jgi:hypothetical protein
MDTFKEEPTAPQPRAEFRLSCFDGARGGTPDRRVAPSSKQSIPKFLGWIAGLNREIRPSIGRVYGAGVLRFARWNLPRAALIGSAGLFWWLSCECAPIWR